MFSGLAGLQIAAENEQFEVAGAALSDPSKEGDLASGRVGTANDCAKAAKSQIVTSDNSGDPSTVGIGSGMLLMTLL